MKSKSFVLCLAFLITCSFLFAQSVDIKENFFQKIIDKYRDVKEMSASLEINMSMMGSIMKMPMKIWIKGDKSRMDFSISIPGQTEPMQQIVLNNSKSISMYNNLNNTIMTMDLTKIPEDTKKKISRSNNFILWSDTELLNRIKSETTVEETSKNGKNVYLITVKNLEAIQNSFNFPTDASAVFKKMIYWVDQENLIPVKMELYVDANTPGIWIDFFDIKIVGVPDNIFDVKFPADAKKIDMTDSLKDFLPK